MVYMDEIEFYGAKPNRLTRRILILLSVFLLTVFASQCFAQSNSLTAEQSALNSRQYMELMNSVFDFVQKNYVDEVPPDVLYKGALKGMLDSLNDQHTSYLDTSTQRSLDDTMAGQFGGVGLTISKAFESTPDKPAYVEVTSPVEDTPGFRAGIQAGDLIISANGTDTSTITMDEVLGILRGKVGEPVELVIRRGKNMEFPVTLIRALIEVPTVKYGLIGKIGYIRIIEFTPLTPDKIQEAIDSFKKEGITSLIIDVRNNPGGLLASVVDVLDKFIDNGPIVSTKSRIPYQNSVYNASPRRTTIQKGLPIIVLINRGSASCSEILSGALKDNHLAYLVGENTYGKGSVQQVVPLPSSANEAIKLTVARYYTPSDTNIDKVGIPPDREVLYPALTEEAEKEYIEMIKGEEISKYVDAHPDMTESAISAYAKTLHQKYSHIDERTIRRLVRIQVNRLKPAMLYDLDYDIQLNAAIDILEKEDFQNLVRTTKTLKELQDESKLGKKTEDSAKK